MPAISDTDGDGFGRRRGFPYLLFTLEREHTNAHNESLRLQVGQPVQLAPHFVRQGNESLNVLCSVRTDGQLNMGTIDFIVPPDERVGMAICNADGCDYWENVYVYSDESLLTSRSDEQSHAAALMRSIRKRHGLEE